MNIILCLYINIHRFIDNSTCVYSVYFGIFLLRAARAQGHYEKFWHLEEGMAWEPSGLGVRPLCIPVYPSLFFGAFAGVIYFAILNTVNTSISNIYNYS